MFTVVRLPRLCQRLGYSYRRTAVSNVRYLSSSSSSLLIEDSKYSWLKELGLKADNPGVFDGSWHGSGKVIGAILYSY